MHRAGNMDGSEWRRADRDLHAVVGNLIGGEIEQAILAGDDIGNRRYQRGAVHMPESAIAFHDGLDVVALLRVDEHRVPIGTHLQGLGQVALLLQKIDRLGDKLQRHNLGQYVGGYADQAAEEQRHHARRPGIVRQPRPNLAGQQTAARVADIDVQRRDAAFGVVDAERYDLLVLDLMLDAERKPAGRWLIGIGEKKGPERGGHISRKSIDQSTRWPHSSVLVVQFVTIMLSVAVPSPLNGMSVMATICPCQMSVNAGTS